MMPTNYRECCKQNKMSAILQERSFINYIKKENILTLDFKDIARETRRDPIISKVCDTIKQGTIKNLNDDDLNKGVELSVDYDCSFFMNLIWV